jgi:hypothetical protein
MLALISSGFLFNLVIFEQKVPGVKGVFFVEFGALSFSLYWINNLVSGLL